MKIFNKRVVEAKATDDSIIYIPGKEVGVINTDRKLVPTLILGVMVIAMEKYEFTLDELIERIKEVYEDFNNYKRKRKTLNRAFLFCLNKPS